MWAMSREMNGKVQQKCCHIIKDSKVLQSVAIPPPPPQNFFPSPLQCFFSYNHISKRMKMLYTRETDEQIFGTAQSKEDRLNSWSRSTPTSTLQWPILKPYVIWPNWQHWSLLISGDLIQTFSFKCLLITATMISPASLNQLPTWNLH